MLRVNKDIKFTIPVHSSINNKELSIKMVAYDKDTFNKLSSFVSQLKKFNLIKYSRIYLCEFQDNEWITDTRITYNINEYQPNYIYFYSSKTNFYSYKKIIELLDKDNIIILANK